MLLNLLRYNVKLSFYYVKKRFIKALSVYLAVIYRMNARMAIKELINLFIADFAELINNKIRIGRVPDTFNTKQLSKLP